jgi:plastocyanin
MRLKALVTIASVTTFLWVGLPISASAKIVPAHTFTIGVDHADPANQQLDNNGNPTTPPGVQAKVFEYTDFFTRSLKVHQGDTVDFRFAIPDHLITVAPDEAAARQQLPLFAPDERTAAEGNALGSGGPKVVLGPAVFLGFGGSPSCGQSAASQCLFNGSAPSDPGFASSSPDWFVQINAAPGIYTYFCHLHPGMRGTLKVVPNHVATQTQNQIDRQSAVQFHRAQREAMTLYDEANQVDAQQENSGPTVYNVHVGVTSRDQHVAIHDMLPSKLRLNPGDVVHYHWQTNVIHTVGFPAGLVSPFGVDCETSYAPLASPTAQPICPSGAPETDEASLTGIPVELIADPGNQASGSPLTAASDSGLLVGASYAQYYGGMGASTWSVKASAPGAYQYQCTIHDWMRGTITVGS